MFQTDSRDFNKYLALESVNFANYGNDEINLKKEKLIKMSEKVKIFHQKLPQLIEDVIAPMGRFQYAIVFILCFNNSITAISNVVTTFYSYQPAFVCGVSKS